MRKNKMNNVEVLRRFEIACFQLTNYPNNKAKAEEFRSLEKEIAKRLGVEEEELADI